MIIDTRKQLAEYAEKILTFLGITCENGYRDRGGFIMGSAPCHGGDNPTGFSVKIFPSHATWSCWTHHCEEEYGRDMIGLIKAVKKVDENVAIFMAEQIIHKNGIKIPKKQPEIKKEIINHWAKHFNQTVLEPMMLTDPSIYCKERGFDIMEVQSYGMGIATDGIMAGRFVVPIRNKRYDTVGYSGRLIKWTKENKEGKWKHYPKGFTKGINLFNIERLNKNKSEFVILTEGPFDALKFEMSDVPNAVAILGDNICNGQIELLNHLYFTEVIIALDNDEAGKKGTERAARKLEKQKFRLWTIEVGHSKKDWGECSGEEIIEAINNKKRL